MAAGPIRVLMVNARTTEFGSAIGHYTDQLCAELGRSGVAVERLQRAEWGPSAVRPSWRALRAAHADIVHVQYPMYGYGRSLVPHLLALGSRSVVTVHEASMHGRFTGRTMLFPMLIRSQLAFTSGFELAHTQHWARWISARASVIPIGSNIREVLPREPGERTMLTFGSVYRGKGLDAVVELAALARAAGMPWRVRIAGDAGGHPGPYERQLHEAAVGLDVEFTGRLEETAVAEAFAQATVGYFPFRDGASERRGSLLAAFAAGLPVISTVGRQTTAEIRAAIIAANTPAEALAAANQMVADPAEQARLSAAGRAYAAKRSWEAIAARHIALYEAMLHGGTTKGRPEAPLSR